MAIVGAMVVPMVFGLGGVSAMSAARILATDVEYAQNVAITTQQSVTVTFATGTDTYTLSNASGALKHPMTNADYVVDLRSQEQMDDVDILTADFDGAATVTFDELGSPDNGGTVTLQGGPDVYQVQVTPVTGTVTVTLAGS